MTSLPTGHIIRFTLDNGGWFKAEAMCQLDADADCRLTSVSCECEEWGPIQRRDDGTIWHRIVDEGPMEPLWHEVEHGDDCNVCLFLNESDCIEELMTKGSDTLHLADVPIKPIWDCDGYEWEPVK